MSSVPPPPTPEVMEWASYVQRRKPQYKLHRTQGLAKAAVMYNEFSWPRGGVVFQLRDGKWEEVFSYTQDKTCVLCHEVKDEARVSLVRYIPPCPPGADRRKHYREHIGANTKLAHMSCYNEQRKRERAQSQAERTIAPVVVESDFF